MGIAAEVRGCVGHHLRGTGVEFTEDGEQLMDDSLSSLGSDSYDYIACTHWLEHQEEPSVHVSEWWNAIHPGGKLLLVLPHKKLYPGAGDPGNPDHRHQFDDKDAIGLLQSIGAKFKVIDSGIHDRALSFWVVFEKMGVVGKRKLKTFPADHDVEYDIVIPFDGMKELTEGCLQSIADAGWTPNNVILVNDGEDDIEFDDDYGFPVRVVPNTRTKGFPDAINTGVAECTSQFVVLLNNDTAVYQGADRTLIGPLFDISTGMTGQSGGRHDSNMEYSGGGSDYIAMYCCAFRRAMWKELDGIFSPGYGEDADYGIRLRRDGFELVFVRGVCEHFGGASFGRTQETLDLIQRNADVLRRRYAKKKALFVVASVGRSGGIKVIWNCARALREDGWWVEVMLDARTDGWSLDAPVEWAENFDGFHTRETVFKSCEERPFDMVMGTFQRTWPLIVDVDAACYIGLVQSDEPSWYQYADEHRARAEEAFRTPGLKHIIVADHMWGLAEKYGFDIVGKIDNGVNDLIFHPLWTFDDMRPPTMLTIRKGNKVWFDGQEHVDVAAEILAKEYDDFHYIIVGNKELRAECMGLGRPPNCSYEVVDTHEEDVICETFNQAGAYVIPSLIEGSSITALESMACGIPLVCTPIASDAAVDGETALVVPYGRPKKIADAVSSLFDDNELRRKLSSAGLKMALTRTHKRQREQFIDCVDKAMEG